MSLDKFEQFKQRFMNTKPIRGRSTEIRPIGQRRRDWEQVVKRYIVEEGALDVEGGEAYGAHLYRTDCVMYMANGDMLIKTDGYDTPTTAEFINRYIPRNMSCRKQYNKLWITYKEQSYVIDNKKTLTFRYSRTEDAYSVENPVQLSQKVVDRAKMKTARDKLQGFRDYARVMLKLADGWLSHELVAQHSSGKADYYGRKGYELDGDKFDRYGLSGSISKSTAEKIYNAMCTATEEQYPKLLCMICAGTNYQDSRTVRVEKQEWTDFNGNTQIRDVTIREEKYDHKSVDNRINHYIKQACDVYTTKEVAMGVIATNIV